MQRRSWHQIIGAALGILLAQGYRLYHSHGFQGWHDVLVLAESFTGAMLGGLSIEVWRMRRGSRSSAFSA